MSKKRITEGVSIPEINKALEILPKSNEIFLDNTFDIAEYVSYILADKNISQKELALELNKSEAEISKWLSGNHNLTLRTISKLEGSLPINIINPLIKYYLKIRRSKNRISSSTITVNNDSLNELSVFILLEEGSTLYNNGTITTSLSAASYQKLEDILN